MTGERLGATIKSMPFAAALGIVIGIAISPGGGFDWLYGLWDEFNPVVSMSGKIVDRNENTIVVHIAGDKLRDCEYLAIKAYADVDGRLRDINTVRESMPQDGSSKPVGSYDIGRWRAWPVVGAKRVIFATTHSCSGRLITTKIADVPV